MYIVDEITKLIKHPRKTLAVYYSTDDDINFQVRKSDLIPEACEKFYSRWRPEDSIRFLNRTSYENI